MKITGKFATRMVVSMLLLQALIFAGVQTASAAGAREYENPPCFDITGATKVVSVGGVNNGGIMDFDDAGVGAQYQACVRMSSSLPGAVPARVEGWVWNSNLGWVSLYCPGGAGAKNLDINCGNQAYGVTFSTLGTAPDFTDVSLNGYAWGDNTGWISFNSAFHVMKPRANGLSRGLVPGAPSTNRFAWTDSLGWLDFDGVWFHWEDTDPPMTDPNVLTYISICSSKDSPVPGPYSSTCSCDLDGTCPALTDPSKTPDADGTDKYVIEIPFVDGGAKIPNTNMVECPSTSINMYTLKPGVQEYCGKIELVWEDDVDFDQTTAANQTQSTPKFNANNNGAVIKPLSPYSLSGPSSFLYSAGSLLWGANVVSYAPTSDKNVSGGLQNEKFYYYNVAEIGGYDPNKSDQNLLKLKELKLMLFKYSTSAGLPGSCIYGTINGSNCEMRNYMMAGGTTFGFNPLIKADNLVYVTKDTPSKDLNFIALNNVDVSQDFRIDNLTISPNAISPSADFRIGLMDETAYQMKFVDAFPKTDPGDSGVADSNTLTAPVASLPWYAQVFTIDAAETISAVNPYLYSKVTYTPLSAGPMPQVKYWGIKLPRIRGGALMNPVAKVQGNVYVTDFAKKAADVSLRSLGNISSNLRREAVVRNVAKYLTGFPVADISEGNKTVSTGTTGSIIGITELIPDKVFYVKNGNLTINCPGGCSFDKNATFIVENGNIYVHSNILNPGGSQVGLIALRNLQGNVQNQGFLYLDKDVTWLQNVQIYLDRVMQSYDKTITARDANGLALTIGDDYERQSLFKNQLVIEGTISSMNGIGNASGTPPTDENGKAVAVGSYCSNYVVLSFPPAPPAALSGICRARSVDLNYLRYYGPGLELCNGSEGVGAVANVPRDQQLKNGGSDPAGGCNPAASGYDIDATNLYDEQPTYGDLITGAAGGSRSQYFTSKGLPKILANEYPVNFFYKPIAKDLAGFEVEQAINPLIQ